MIRFYRPIMQNFILFIIFIFLPGFLSSQVTVNNIRELRALLPGEHETVKVLSYYSAGDWGEPRTYRWTQPSSESDNGGTVIVPRTASTGRWIMEVTEDYYSVKWFGARGQDNPNHDDYIGIMNCIEAAAASHVINRVFFPVGIYQVNQRIRFYARHSGLTLVGENLAFKYQEVYPTTVENGRLVRLTHPRVHIDWSPVKEFRVVDESKSAVLKRADGFFTAHWFTFYSDQGTITNLTIKNLAFNGNRWDTLEIPYPEGYDNATNIQLTEGSADGTVRFRNIASYLSPKHGIGLGGTYPYFDTILVYSNNWHGIVGFPRNTDEPAIFNNIEIHNCSYDEQLVNYYSTGKSWYGGAQGIDTGGNVIIENMWSHHNWEGHKTTGSARGWIIIRNSIFEYNRSKGIQQTGSQEDFELTWENVTSQYNGDAGIRNMGSKKYAKGTLYVRGNGINPTSSGLAGLYVSNLSAEKILIEDHSEVSSDGFSRVAIFFGMNEISNLEIINNQLTGLSIVDGTTIIRSGKILNNNSVGISLSSGASLDITNVKFGDTQPNPTQTRYEITGSEANIKYGNLDFSESQVSTGNRINVGNAVEIGAIYIGEPEANIMVNSRDGMTITTNVTHPSARIIRVEFFANGTKIGERTEPPYSFSWSEMRSGTYTVTATATFSDNSTATSNSIRVLVSGSHSVLLTPGWNTISSYLEPDNTSISNIFQDMGDNLLLVRDNTGQVYWPAFSIDDIPEWDPTQGYEIFMDKEDTLTIYGMPVLPENTYIHLSKGWNLTGYLLEHPVQVEEAFKNILPQLQLVTNNSGEIYWPEYGVNSIGSLKPGEGYRIFVESPATFLYSTESAVTKNLTAGSVQSRESGFQKTSSHYRLSIGKTGSKSVLMVKSRNLRDGDEIGVWSSDDRLVGSGIVANGRAAITVWGENPVSPQPEIGAKSNDPLQLTLWSHEDEEEHPLPVVRLRALGRGERDSPVLRYEANAVLITDVTTPYDIPERYSLEQNFPNPFNPTTTIRYAIPRDEPVTLEVYNLIGQLVTTLVDERQDSGSYEVVFKAEMLASGVYFYRLIAGNFTEVKRMIILR
jgi:hypothetical protein